MADGTSYYKVAVTSGLPYTVALAGGFRRSNADVSLFVYGTDPTFNTTPVCSSEADSSVEEECTLTAGGQSMFLSVVNFDGVGDAVLTLTVLSSDGTSAAPLPLYLDKWNFGHVNDLTSYYSIGLTQGLTYRNTFSFFTTVGAFFDYNEDATFTPPEDCTQTAGGGSAFCDTTAAGNNIYFAVTDNQTLRGSYYLFRMTLKPVSVVSATATSATAVDVLFSANLDPASVQTNGSQFTISGLSVSSASVNGNTVSLLTGAQSTGTPYTVIVADTVRDVDGGTLDPNADFAIFNGYGGGG